MTQTSAEAPDMFGDIARALKGLIERYGRRSEEVKNFLEHALKRLCAYKWEEKRLKNIVAQTTLPDFGMQI